MKLRHFLFSLISSILLFFSCKRGDDCPKHPDEYHVLSQRVLGYIPYNGNDTLTFIHRKGTLVDTVRYYCTGKKIDTLYAGDARYCNDNASYSISYQRLRFLFKAKDTLRMVILGNDDFDIYFKGKDFPDNFISMKQRGAGIWVYNAVFENELFPELEYIGDSSRYLARYYSPSYGISRIQISEAESYTLKIK